VGSKGIGCVGCCCGLHRFHDFAYQLIICYALLKGTTNIPLNPAKCKF
jgi:hypothetical protein